MNDGFVLVHTHRGSGKDTLVDSHRKSCKRKWLSCTVVGIEGNQCSSCRCGVTWSYSDFLRMSFAAVLCVRACVRACVRVCVCVCVCVCGLCQREICFNGNPAQMKLQLSSRDVMADKTSWQLHSESSMVRLKLFI